MLSIILSFKKIFFLCLILLVLIGCNSQTEELSKFEIAFNECSEKGGELLYENQCFKDGLIKTPNQEIDLNTCNSYFDGCNECKIVNSRTANLDCNSNICFKHEEPICRSSTFREEDNSFCTSEYFPVCGEDLKTYSNDCMAKKANVKVAYVGVCK